MDPLDEWNHKREMLKREINDGPFFGPYIVANGKSGNIGERLSHTGFSIQVATADNKIDAEILRLKDSFWFSPEQLIVPRGKLGFTFPQFSQDTVRLIDLLNQLASLRESPMNIPDLLVQLEPLMRGIRRAPLKRNARECMKKDYRALGLAIAPVKLVKDRAVVRVVWIFPSDRTSASSSCYIPVATMSIPVSGDGSLGEGEIAVPVWNAFFGYLIRYVAQKDRENPVRMLSSEGRREIETAILSRRDGGHPRTKRHRERIDFVLAHSDLWDRPSALGLKLKEAGLYGAKLTKSTLEWQTRNLIVLAKERDADAKTPTS